MNGTEKKIRTKMQNTGKKTNFENPRVADPGVVDLDPNLDKPGSGSDSRKETRIQPSLDLKKILINI